MSYGRLVGGISSLMVADHLVSYGAGSLVAGGGVQVLHSVDDGSAGEPPQKHRSRCRFARERLQGCYAILDHFRKLYRSSALSVSL